MPSTTSPRLRIASRVAAILTVAVVAVGATACGGEDEVPTAEQWAGDLCTAVNTWRDSISSAVATITANPSQAGLEDAVDEASSATETLIDDVRDLGAPDTEAGEQAQETVDQLADTAETSVDTIQQAVDEVSGGSGLLEAVSTISATISAFSDTVSESLDELRGLEDVDDELRAAFEDAESCEGLGQNGS